MPNNKKKYEQSKKSRLKIRFGITVEEYNEMFDKQNGRCAICGRHQSELKKALEIDHKHIGNYKDLSYEEKHDSVRGLLCWRCNFMLGLATEDFGILQKAMEYLSHYSNVGECEDFTKKEEGLNE